MKQTLSILISLIILAQPVNNLLILISFEINREYIRNYLCEKKVDPDNCCQGKCWLEKELGGSGENQSEPLQPTRINLPDCKYIIQSQTSLSKPFCIQTTGYCTYCDQNKLKGFGVAVFQPPELVI